MSDLSSDFGDLGLSSNAREWKPPGAGDPQQNPPHLPHAQVPSHFQRQPRPPPPPSRNQQPSHLTSNLTPLGSASPARSVSSRNGGGGGSGSSTTTKTSGGPASASAGPKSGTRGGPGGNDNSSESHNTTASVASQGSFTGKTESTVASGMSVDNASMKTTTSLPSGERNDWEELESELNAATVKEYVPGRAWGDDKSKAGSVGSQGKKKSLVVRKFNHADTRNLDELVVVRDRCSPFSI